MTSTHTVFEQVMHQIGGRFILIIVIIGIILILITIFKVFFWPKIEKKIIEWIRIKLGRR